MCVQRIREQIRRWASDATIRDMSLLIEARHAMLQYCHVEQEQASKQGAKANQVRAWHSGQKPVPVPVQAILRRVAHSVRFPMR